MYQITIAIWISTGCLLYDNIWNFFFGKCFSFMILLKPKACVSARTYLKAAAKDKPMLTIHAVTDRRITAERKALACEFFDACGFEDQGYTMADQIDNAKKWILDNIEQLEDILPKYVLGNIASGLHSHHSRRSLLSFVRRIAIFLNGNVLSRRVQYQTESGQNNSKYMYKLIV